MVVMVGIRREELFLALKVEGNFVQTFFFFCLFEFSRKVEEGKKVLETVGRVLIQFYMYSNTFFVCQILVFDQSICQILEFCLRE